MLKKVCTKCNIEKPVSEFAKAKTGTYGVRGNCKECDKNYRQQNKDHIKKYTKKYHQENKEATKLYYQKNKDKIDSYRLEYKNKKYKEDINYRLRNILRSRTQGLLKDFFNRKNTLDLLGCTIEELKKHLESQFKEGMNWDNYGIKGWHIDHIKPCVTFDLSKESEQRVCFNYKNLQPLWAKENLSKGSNYKDKILEKRNTVVKN